MAVERVEPLEDVPGGYLEFHSDGRIIAKNGDNQFITHPKNYNPPEAMGRVRSGHNKLRSQPVLDEVEALMAALPAELLADDREAWIIRHLGMALAAGGAGSASVAKELIARIGLAGSERSRKPESGTVCPCCGQMYLKDYAAPGNILRGWIADLRAVRAELGEDVASVEVERLSESETELPYNHGQVV